MFGSFAALVNACSEAEQRFANGACHLRDEV